MHFCLCKLFASSRRTWNVFFLCYQRQPETVLGMLCLQKSISIIEGIFSVTEEFLFLSCSLSDLQIKLPLLRSDGSHWLEGGTRPYWKISPARNVVQEWRFSVIRFFSFCPMDATASSQWKRLHVTCTRREGQTSWITENLPLALRLVLPKTHVFNINMEMKSCQPELCG